MKREFDEDSDPGKTSREYGLGPTEHRLVHMDWDGVMDALRDASWTERNKFMEAKRDQDDFEVGSVVMDILRDYCKEI